MYQIGKPIKVETSFQNEISTLLKQLQQPLPHFFILSIPLPPRKTLAIGFYKPEAPGIKASTSALIASRACDALLPIRARSRFYRASFVSGAAVFASRGAKEVVSFFFIELALLSFFARANSLTVYFRRGISVRKGRARTFVSWGG